MTCGGEDVFHLLGPVLAIFVIIGTVPIAIVGLALKHFIENDLRSLWVVAIGLIAWSAVMIFAEHAAEIEAGRTNGGVEWITDQIVQVIGLHAIGAGHIVWMHEDEGAKILGGRP